MARRRQVRRRSVAGTPHPPCASCGGPVARRPDEHPSNYEKRRTCGARECVDAHRRRACGQQLGPDRDDWWAPLPAAPVFAPDAFAATDPRAAAPEPPLRQARPDPEHSSYAGNRWAEMGNW